MVAWLLVTRDATAGVCLHVDTPAYVFLVVYFYDISLFCRIFVNVQFGISQK